MTREVERIDVSGSSTALRLALMEMLELEEIDNYENADDGGNSSKEDTITEMDNSILDEEDDDVEDVSDKSLPGGVSIQPEKDEPDDNTTEEPVRRETLYFFEITDKSRTGSFRPKSDTVEKRKFPLNTSGQIETILVIAQSDTFNITLDIDNDKVLDNNSWQSINDVSQELSHIAGYQRSSGEYVLSISDYPFNDRLDFSIKATGQTTFDRIRVEVMVDEFTRGAE